VFIVYLLHIVYSVILCWSDVTKNRSDATTAKVGQARVSQKRVSHLQPNHKEVSGIHTELTLVTERFHIFIHIYTLFIFGLCLDTSAIIWLFLFHTLRVVNFALKHFSFYMQPFM